MFAKIQKCITLNSVPSLTMVVAFGIAPLKGQFKFRQILLYRALMDKCKTNGP